MPVEHGVHALCFDDRWLYAASDQRITRVDPETPERTTTVSFTDVKIQYLHVTSDAVLVAGAYRIEYGFVAKLPLKELFQPQSELKQSASDLLGVELFALWSVCDLPSPVTATHVTTDSIVVGDRDGVLRSLSLTSGELNWKVTAHSKLVTCVTSIATPDASVWLASGDWGGKIVISDARDGQPIESYALHRDAITDLVSLPGRPAKLVSSSRDGTVRLWYVDQHRLVRFYRQASPVLSLSPWQDDIVLSATRDSALLWIDISSAECVRRAECPIDYIHAQATSSRHIAISNGRNQLFLAARPAQ